MFGFSYKQLLAAGLIGAAVSAWTRVTRGRKIGG